MERCVLLFVRASGLWLSAPSQTGGRREEGDGRGEGMAAVAAVQQQAHKSSRRTTVHAANDSSAGAHCRVGEGGEIVRT